MREYKINRVEEKKKIIPGCAYLGEKDLVWKRISRDPELSFLCFNRINSIISYFFPTVLFSFVVTKFYGNVSEIWIKNIES